MELCCPGIKIRLLLGLTMLRLRHSRGSALRVLLSSVLQSNTVVRSQSLSSSSSSCTVCSIFFLSRILASFYSSWSPISPFCNDMIFLSRQYHNTQCAMRSRHSSANNTHVSRDLPECNSWSDFASRSVTLETFANSKNVVVNVAQISFHSGLHKFVSNSFFF